MKKGLLIVAAMFAAVCANAQGAWNAVPESAAVDDVVATAGSTTVAVDDIQNAEIVLVDGGSNWTVKNLPGEVGTFESQGKTFSKAYIQGGTNGNDASLMYKDNTKRSAQVQFTPSVSGKLYVAAKYGASKKIYAAKVPNADLGEAFDYSAVSAYATDVWGMYITADGGVADAQSATEDVYAALVYDVEPDYTYFFWVSGSKIMLCGLTFEAGDTGVKNAVVEQADANAPVYNLAGQRVDASFKGIAIQNGKKFVK